MSIFSGYLLIVRNKKTWKGVFWYFEWNWEYWSQMQLLPLFVELFFFFASKRRWKFGREWFWRIRTVGRGGDTLRFSTNKPASVALCLSASVPWWHCTVPPVSLAIVLWVASGHMVGTVPQYHNCTWWNCFVSSRSSCFLLALYWIHWEHRGALEQCGEVWRSVEQFVEQC